MGILTGLLAAVTVLPTAIALYAYYSDAERVLAERQSVAAAAVASSLIEERVERAGLEASLPPDIRQLLQVDAIYAQDAEGILFVQEGMNASQIFLERVCKQEVPTLYNLDQNPYVFTCHATETHSVITAIRPQQVALWRITGIVLALALIVGIVTALGVLRLLTPLSRVSNALKRVSFGERGVRVRPSGLAELDELVARLNTAARAMEEREDAVSARIQVVQEMARIVAHEIRNPLQSLELLTSLVAAADTSQEREELVQSIHEEIRTLDQVVTRLLRRGAGDSLRLIRSQMPISKVLNQVLAVRRLEAESKGISLMAGEISDVEAFIDQALIGRSLENLVKNAMQVVPEDRGIVQVTLVEDGGYVNIVVEDNGPGVDPSVEDHLFEVDVSARAGGTGLGLALVKGVIEAHGGFIEHDRSILGGARFTAHIPVIEV
jgi:signal transduction histidine kinase